MLSILFWCFFALFILYILQHCMVGLIILILQMRKLRVEGTKELGQKYTSPNCRVRLAPRSVCYQNQWWHQHCTTGWLIYTVRIWQKINCTFNIISPISSKEPKKLIKLLSRYSSRCLIRSPATENALLSQPLLHACELAAIFVWYHPALHVPGQRWLVQRFPPGPTWLDWSVKLSGFGEWNAEKISYFYVWLVVRNMQFGHCGIVIFYHEGWEARSRDKQFALTKERSRCGQLRDKQEEEQVVWVC